MYEQMSFDISLDSGREVQENILMAIDFAGRQISEENTKHVESKHEGYGIAAEKANSLNNAVKGVSESMKQFLRILSADEGDAISAASSLKNAATLAAVEAVLLAANADKIMNDLYRAESSRLTPLEEYIADQEQFEEAGEAADDEGQEDEENE